MGFALHPRQSDARVEYSEKSKVTSQLWEIHATLTEIQYYALWRGVRYIDGIYSRVAWAESSLVTLHATTRILLMSDFLQ